MNKTDNKRSGFSYEPVGKSYSSDTKIIKHKDGTISLKPSKNTPNPKKNGK